MELKYVTIDKGGNVKMKKDESHDFKEEHKEEQAITDVFCSVINADKKLQVFFAEKLSGILKTFAKDIIAAYMAKDKVKAAAVTQQAGEGVKGLTMFMHVKVMMKKKEAKP